LSWLMITIDTVCALVAVLLASLSLYTLGTMCARGIRKSLWVPILVANVFFMLGSISSILENFMTITEELEILHHTSWLIGLGILTYSVYIYFRIVRKAT